MPEPIPDFNKAQKIAYSNIVSFPVCDSTQTYSKIQAYK